MSGLSPEQVVEAKHAMAGLAELARAFWQELRDQGFSRSEALNLTARWLDATIKASMNSGDE